MFPSSRTLCRRDVKLTLQFYSHAVSRDRMSVVGETLIAILGPRDGSRRTESGLKRNRAGRKFFTIIQLKQLFSGHIPNVGLRADERNVLVQLSDLSVPKHK